MLKLLLCSLLGTLAFASTITVNYTGSSCVMGVGGPPPVPGVTGLGSTSVVATSNAGYNPPGIGSLPASSCEVIVSDNLISSGSGSGFLSFSLLGDAETDPSFEVNGVTEGGCGEIGCDPANGTIPITLGVPFQISVEADAEYAPVGCCFEGSYIEATIQVYQAVNVAPVGVAIADEYQTISEAPEIGTSGLVLVGLALVALKRASVWTFCRPSGASASE